MNYWASFLFIQLMNATSDVWINTPVNMDLPIEIQPFASNLRRRLILEVVFSQKDNFTISTIMDALNAEHLRINRSTVSDLLIILVRRGLIKTVESERTGKRGALPLIFTLQGR